MVLRLVVPVALGVTLMSGATASAADYRPDEFLTLDLSKAVLSPRPLGPEAHFEPMPVEDKADQNGDQLADRQSQQAAPAVATVQPAAKPEAPRRVATARVHHARSLDRRGAARMKLAHRRGGNPLDAQAMDTRIQTWPCRPGSGGICNWR